MISGRCRAAMQVMNVSDQQNYEKKLSAWERECERQKVEFTITEKDLDADLRVPSPEVLVVD